MEYIFLLTGIVIYDNLKKKSLHVDTFATVSYKLYCFMKKKRINEREKKRIFNFQYIAGV